MADNTADSIITATEKYVVPLCLMLTLTTGILLFLPAGASLFQLTRLPTWITDFQGLIFIFSVVIMVLLIGRAIGRSIARRRFQADYRQAIVKNLWALSGQEQAILREFFLFYSDVQDLPMQDPAVLSLRNKRILSVAATSGLLKGRNMEFPFQLPPRVKELVEPGMIALPEAQQLYDRDKTKFEASRPHFRQQNSYW